jgi:O-antigen ligase
MAIIKDINYNKKYSPIFFVSFFLYLIPIALITGPFLPDLFCTITIILFIIFFLKKSYNILTNKIIFILLLAWLYFFCRSIFYGDIEIILRTFFYIRFILLSVCIAYCHQINKNFQHYFLFSIIVSLFIVLISGYIEFFFKYNPFRSIGYLNNRLSGIFGDEMIIGSFLSVLVPLSSALLISYNKKILHYLSLFLIISGLILVLVSQERAATVIICIFIICYFLFLIFFKNKKYYIDFFVTLFIFFFVLSNNTSVKNRFLTIIEAKNIISLEQSNHAGHYLTAYKMFKDNIIFGQGPRTFRILCEKEEFLTKNGCSTHPHNFFLQLLAETGLVGSFLFYTFYLYVLSYSIKLIFSFKHPNYINHFSKSFFLCVLVLAEFFPLVPSGNFFVNWLNIRLFLPIGFLVAQIIIEKKNINAI